MMTCSSSPTVHDAQTAQHAQCSVHRLCAQHYTIHETRARACAQACVPMEQGIAPVELGMAGRILWIWCGGGGWVVYVCWIWRR